MFEDIKNQIIYEDFDSREIFRNELQKKLEKLEEKKEDFNSIEYTDSELSNNILEKKITKEFEEYNHLLEQAIDDIENSIGRLR